MQAKLHELKMSSGDDLGGISMTGWIVLGI
jgi:hypothetical protein